MARYQSIEQIKAANERLGCYFFSPDAMRFFNSRILSRVLAGKYFVTSERRRGAKRIYRVREALPDGGISSYHLGKISKQRFTTARQAYAAIKGLVT